MNRDKTDYKKMQDDLFIEMLDVFFNSILYVRDVYPSAIFRPRRVYSTGVYVSILPPLNDYLKKVLQTAQELHVEKNLRSVELVIYREGFEMFDDYFEERVLEKFVFQVEPNEDYKTLRRTNVGSYLLKFEEQVRQALFQLNHICKNMQPLEYEHNFRIQLETTELAFTQLVSRDNSKSKEEEFPWVRAFDEEEEENNEKIPENWRVLPILQNKYFNMFFQTQK